MTYFVKLENGAPLAGIIVEENLRQTVPALSSVQLFTPEIVEPHGYGIFDFSSQPTLGKYEKVVEVLPVRDQRGIWMQTWEVHPMNADEILEVDEGQAKVVRMRRGIALTGCDWTQLVDAPLTAEKKSEWATYRQALRDVPSQAGFPWEVVWPTKPQ